MAAKITELIPDQKFELYRNKLVQILGDELANQYALDHSRPWVKTVWAERFVVIDSETETPTVNVCMDRGDFGNATVKKADGSYLFNIDVYTSAPSTDGGMGGDQAAALEAMQIAGWIAAILRNPLYNEAGRLLDLPDGLVIRTTVVRMFVIEKNTVKDALSDFAVRVQFLVEGREDVQLIPQALNLLMWTTHVLLNEGPHGFYYQSEYVPPEPEVFVDEEEEAVFQPENATPVESPLVGKKFSEVTEAGELGALDLFVGIKKNEDGSYTNYNFTPGEIVGYAKGLLRMMLTVDADGESIKDDWIAEQEVQALMTDRAVYLRDVDWVQEYDKITGINISFGKNQQILLLA